jgi:glycosyltransferase involved in cell wall biosynthesis
MRRKEINISVVTAVFNGDEYLPRLINSLHAQTDKDFEWVVADGGSKDRTIMQLTEASDLLKIKIDSRPDFGIYDALNRAVKMAGGDYYLVLGADDELMPDAIENYKKACTESLADFVTAKIEVNGEISSSRSPSWEWLYSQFAHVSAHAVGLVIKKNLHDKFGFYSRKFPIAADQLFILESIHGGATVSKQNFIAGKFSQQGVSGADLIGTITEWFRVQIHVGHNTIIQLILMVIRILRSYKQICRNKKNDQ